MTLFPSSHFLHLFLPILLFSKLLEQHTSFLSLSYFLSFRQAYLLCVWEFMYVPVFVFLCCVCITEEVRVIRNSICLWDNGK